MRWDSLQNEPRCPRRHDPQPKHVWQTGKGVMCCRGTGAKMSALWRSAEKLWRFGRNSLTTI